MKQHIIVVTNATKFQKNKDQTKERKLVGCLASFCSLINSSTSENHSSERNIQNIPNKSKKMSLYRNHNASFRNLHRKSRWHTANPKILNPLLLTSSILRTLLLILIFPVFENIQYFTNIKKSPGQNMWKNWQCQFCWIKIWLVMFCKLFGQLKILEENVMKLWCTSYDTHNTAWLKTQYFWVAYTQGSKLYVLNFAKYFCLDSSKYLLQYFA